MLKFAWILLLTSCLAFFWWLPNPQDPTPAETYAALPDADLRARAEKAWEAGNEDTALALLDYIIDNELPDTAAAVSQREAYLSELEARDSLFGRLSSAGRGALTGQVDSFESLGGAMVADLFVYGDIRDLVRETVFEAESDPFIVALSSAGLITTLFPPADPAVSAVKASRATGALSKPMTDQLRKALTFIKKNPDSPYAKTRIKDSIMPFFELAKHTRRWSNYQILVRYADNPAQLKAMTRIAAEKPGNAKRLGQILTVAGQGSARQARRSVGLIMDRGQRGMDSLYAALRKGPAGLDIVAKHPTLVARTLKNARRTQVFASQELERWYRNLWDQHGPWLVLGRLLGITVSVALLAFTLWPRRRSAAHQGAGAGSPGRRGGYRLGFGLFLGGAVATTWWIVARLGPSQGGNAPPGDPAVSPGGEAAAMAGGGAGLDGGIGLWLTGTVVLATILVQAFLWWIARRRIQAVAHATTEPAERRLRRLQNLDIYLDLPLYAGLLLTVTAFVLITLDADLSRLLAYTSTILGILVAVSLRALYLQPLQDRLIHEQT
jgi:hypothetical protein